MDQGQAWWRKRSPLRSTLYARESWRRLETTGVTKVIAVSPSGARHILRTISPASFKAGNPDGAAERRLLCSKALLRSVTAHRVFRGTSIPDSGVSLTRRFCLSF